VNDPRETSGSGAAPAADDAARAPSISNLPSQISPAPCAPGVLSGRRSLFAAWVFFAVLAGILLFWSLGHHSLMESTESRYAEIANEMARSGDWTIPRLNYVKHFHKPPLAYWLDAASQKVFGYNEWAVRFPAAVFSLLIALLAGLFARRLFGPRAQWPGALVALSAAGVVGFARTLTADIFLTFFALAALAAAWEVRSGRRGFAWLYYLALGLGFMTKGPVILVIALLPLLVSALALRERRWLRDLLVHPGWLLFAAVGLTWYAVAASETPGLLRYWLLKHTVARVASVDVFHRGAPWYDPIAYLFLLLFPWSRLAAAAGVSHARGLRALFRSPAPGPEPGPAPELDSPERKCFHLAVWILLPLLFFCVIASKLVGYVLPLVPLGAVLAVGLLVEREEKTSSRAAWRYGAGLTLVLLAALGLFVIVLGLLEDPPSEQLRWIQPVAVWVGAAVLCGAALAAAGFFLHSRKIFAAATAATMALILLTGYSRFAKDAEGGRGAFVLAKHILRDLGPDDRIVNFGRNVWNMPFYTGRRIIGVGLAKPRETQFEAPGSFEEYCRPDPRDLQEIVDRPGRTFVVVPFGVAAYAESEAPLLEPTPETLRAWEIVGTLRRLVESGRLRKDYAARKWIIYVSGSEEK